MAIQMVPSQEFKTLEVFRMPDRAPNELAGMVLIMAREGDVAETLLALSLQEAKWLANELPKHFINK